jgi:hypothetical protein
MWARGAVHSSVAALFERRWKLRARGPQRSGRISGSHPLANRQSIGELLDRFDIQVTASSTRSSIAARPTDTRRPASRSPPTFSCTSITCTSTLVGPAEDRAARHEQVELQIAAIARDSSGHALIVVGDTNLLPERACCSGVC